MICPHCNADNREGAKFCNECGMPLSGKMAEVAAALDTQNEKTSQNSEKDRGSSGRVDLNHIPEVSPSLDNGTAKAAQAKEDNNVSNENHDENEKSFDSEQASTDTNEESSIQKDEVVEVPQTSDSLLEHVPYKAAQWDDSSRTADLSGIDECLVDAHYVPPKAQWRTGDTLMFPKIEEGEEKKPQKFSAPDEPAETKAKNPRKKKMILIAVAVIAALALLGAGVTYGMQLWGGKVVPNVIGMTQGDATGVLQDQGFSVRATQVKSDETEGLVLLMDPGANARLPEGSEIIIHVSVGRVMPDLVGKTQEEAMALLHEEDLNNIEIKTERSAEPEGVVLAQSLEAQTRTKAGERIVLTVAERCLVPDITGMTFDAAKEAVEAAGLRAEREIVYDQSVPEGTLVGTDPAAGEKLVPDSVVKIKVAESRSRILTDATWAYLKKYVGSTLNIAGVDYQIVSVDGVTYLGNDTCAYTITCSTTVTILGETLVGAPKQKNGQIVWNKDNTIATLD